MLDRRRLLHLVGCALLVALAAPTALLAAPWVVGSSDSFVVLSGSMEPTFGPGDIIFLSPPRDLGVDDVITFHPLRTTRSLVTHRIVEVVQQDDGLRFRTQGDANEDADPALVHPDDVVGLYRFHIPHIGRLPALLHSQVGYLLLIGLPGVAIIGREFVSLYRELNLWDQARQARPYTELFRRLENEIREDENIGRWLASLEVGP